MKIFSIIALFVLVMFEARFVQADDKELPASNKKVVYVYKQYEKFDLDDLDLQGDSSAPGDLSISPVQERRFTNRLPYRKSFTVEIRKGIERVR